MNTITIFCLLLLGDQLDVDQAFPVDVSRNDSVGKLKEIVKEKNVFKLSGIDANNLKIWKLNVAIDDDELIQNLTSVKPDTLGAKRLTATTLIGKAFPK
jgi:hypothetical protein